MSVLSCLSSSSFVVLLLYLLFASIDANGERR